VDQTRSVFLHKGKSRTLNTNGQNRINKKDHNKLIILYNINDVILTYEKTPDRYYCYLHAGVD
jgi:hypothetical protein